MSRYEVDAVVVGAGVIGLACARALARRGREVVVLEALEAFGRGTSSRNSEVIHSGLYYDRGSSKARLCVEGRRLLYEYCEKNGIPFKRCGKLVVATSANEVDRLDELHSRAVANGVDDVRLLTAADARKLEPALSAEAALSSPSTGIIDSHAYMLALLGDAQAHGAQLFCRSRVQSGTLGSRGIELNVGGPEPFTLTARAVVNAAGLSAPDVAAAMAGLSSRHVPRPLFCKGNYFTLVGPSPFSRLIYPVPEPGGLGVHLTLDLGGCARFGPDTEWLPTGDADSLDYRVDAGRAEKFYACIRRYWPGLPDRALEPGYSGVRPKLMDSEGKPVSDFVICGPADHGIDGLVHLFGFESPGLTASLAIADDVVRSIDP